MGEGIDPDFPSVNEHGDNHESLQSSTVLPNTSPPNNTKKITKRFVESPELLDGRAVLKIIAGGTMCNAYKVKNTWFRRLNI